MAAPVVMVHGAFCAGWVFDAFKTPFEAAGHRVFCPDLRGHAAHDPAHAVVGVSMSEYAADVAALCASLDTLNQWDGALSRGLLYAPTLHTSLSQNSNTG